MFNILVLEALYNLSYDQAEIQVRLSFMYCPASDARHRCEGGSLVCRCRCRRKCFLLDVASLVCQAMDAKTNWLFRESLVRTGAIDNLFARFDKHLSRSG